MVSDTGYGPGGKYTYYEWLAVSGDLPQANYPSKGAGPDVAGGDPPSD